MSDIQSIVGKQHDYFDQGETQSYQFRIKQLKKLQQAIFDNQQRMAKALHEDLGRPEFEAYFEIGLISHDIQETISNLKKWMKPKKVKTGILAQPAKSRVEYCPLGRVLILVPYNYPMALSFQPLTAALAAGNTAIVKQSSVTPASSKLIKEIIDGLYKPQYVASFLGSTDVTNELLEHKFEHIFFTGSPNVGRIVMAAAAKHLTPVTLELGGKSPTIVNKDCNIEQAVKRIISGRFLNAGQTCIAPDHVYVHRDIKDKFYATAKRMVTEFYGENSEQSPHFGRIINDKHFNRVKGLINQDKVLVGGQTNAESRFIAPTILKDVSFSDDAMQEEIFGPVLPVLEFTDAKDVCEQIAKLPQHPLAMYIFTKDKHFEQTLIRKIRCGGVNVNSTMMHFMNSKLPFGGTGESGIGAYHGKQGFELFSHAKSVLNSATWIDVPLRYAPYGNKVKFLKGLVKRA